MKKIILFSLIVIIAISLFVYFNKDNNKENINADSNIELNENEISSSKLSNDQNTISKFIITEATSNDIDYTQTIIEQGAYTVFYTTNEDSLLYMANCWPKNNTQSYGPVYSMESNSYEATAETLKSDVFDFYWEFSNSYDEKKGICKVQLIKMYDLKEVHFILKINIEDEGLLIYKGYMDRAVDFSEFKFK
jgi:hypothetical protein